MATLKELVTKYGEAKVTEYALWAFDRKAKQDIKREEFKAYKAEFREFVAKKKAAGK